jgi:hypothetical protein
MVLLPHLLGRLESEPPDTSVWQLPFSWSRNVSVPPVPSSASQYFVPAVMVAVIVASPQLPAVGLNEPEPSRAAGRLLLLFVYRAT